MKSELAAVVSLFTASYVPSENQDNIQIFMFFGEAENFLKYNRRPF